MRIRSTALLASLASGCAGIAEPPPPGPEPPREDPARGASLSACAVVYEPIEADGDWFVDILSDGDRTEPSVRHQWVDDDVTLLWLSSPESGWDVTSLLLALSHDDRGCRLDALWMHSDFGVQRWFASDDGTVILDCRHSPSRRAVACRFTASFRQGRNPRQRVPA